MARVKKLMVNKNAVTLILLAAGYAVVAWMLYSGHITRQFTNMLIPMSMYIVLAVSLNLVVGFLGELNLGHAGFMSVGLFTGCLASIAMVKSLPIIVRLPLCMLIGGVCAGLFGFIVGMPALRLKGDYLAIVTLACGEIVKNVITNLSVTGGARGLNTQPIYSGSKTLLPGEAIETPEAFLTVGRGGVDKRIDVLATAICGHMTVFDLENLDLAYTPPFSSAKDPVVLGGMIAANVVRGEVEVCLPQDLPALREDPDTVILDVRTQEEWDAGHVEGATLLPVDALRGHLAALDPKKTYAVYCGVGYRAYVACLILKAHGFRAMNVSGGWRAIKMSV